MHNNPAMYKSYDNGYFSNKDRSPEFFQNTRVTTCNHITMQNGKPVAVPFRPMTDSQKSRKKEERVNTQETDTVYRNTYNRHKNTNTGTYKKPLTRYNPSADRNRLPNLSLRMNSPYFDQIELGDKYKTNVGKSNPWVTEYKTRIGNFVDTGCFSHPGI